MLLEIIKIMDREQERQQAAIQAYPENISYSTVIEQMVDYNRKYRQLWLEGAEWADEHPREGLVDIEKVKDFLSSVDLNFYQEKEYKTCNMHLKYEPFDVVIYKPTGERGLVKSCNDSGVFVLFSIQSTAHHCKYEDIEHEFK